jgi:homoserine kinase
MPAVVRAARAAGALGCVLSGAGPSLLAVVEGGVSRAAAVGRAMETALGGAGIGGVARALGVDSSGAVSRVDDA